MFHQFLSYICKIFFLHFNIVIVQLIIRQYVAYVAHIQSTSLYIYALIKKRYCNAARQYHKQMLPMEMAAPTIPLHCWHKCVYLANQSFPLLWPLALPSKHCWQRLVHYTHENKNTTELWGCFYCCHKRCPCVCLCTHQGSFPITFHSCEASCSETAL